MTLIITKVRISRVMQITWKGGMGIKLSLDHRFITPVFIHLPPGKPACATQGVRTKGNKSCRYGTYIDVLHLFGLGHWSDAVSDASVTSPLSGGFISEIGINKPLLP
jgi:hypothetical protein